MKYVIILAAILVSADAVFQFLNFRCRNFTSFTGDQNLLYGRWFAVRSTVNYTCIEMTTLPLLLPPSGPITQLVPMRVNFSYYDGPQLRETNFIAEKDPLRVGLYLAKQNPLQQLLDTFLMVILQANENTVSGVLCPVRASLIPQFEAFYVFTRDGSINADVAGFETYADSIGVNLNNIHNITTTPCPNF